MESKTHNPDRKPLLECKETVKCSNTKWEAQAVFYDDGSVFIGTMRAYDGDFLNIGTGGTLVADFFESLDAAQKEVDAWLERGKAPKGVRAYFKTMMPTFIDDAVAAYYA